MNNILYHLEWLHNQPEHSIKFVFFWDGTPSKDGSLDKSCLSQWWPSAFEVDGIRYPTTEHWMMAQKADLFGSPDIKARILAHASPGHAKDLGRQVPGFDQDVWEARRFDIVFQGNFHKFSQNPPLRDYLLQTGDRVLVEASPIDPIWGIGLSEDDPKAQHPLHWQGQNLLGFALMEVRDRLRNAFKR